MDPILINDQVHGVIRIKEPLLIELLDTPEVQRLRDIYQLGFVHLVYPNATHTRQSHSLGAMHVASKMAEALNLSERDRLIAIASLLLHDVGHGPYSHVFELLVKSKINLGHMDLTEGIISGKRLIPVSKFISEKKPAGRIPEILKKYGISAEEVSALIQGGKNSLVNDIVHSSVDADQIDYMLRDATFTGVSYGGIQVQRLLELMCTDKDGRLCFDKKAINPLMQMATGRYSMYSSVYMHHTVRIAEALFMRLVELNPEMLNLQNGVPKAYAFSDTTFLEACRQGKRAHTVSVSKIQNHVDEIKKLRNENNKLIKTIAERASVSSDYVIVDWPIDIINFTEPRIRKFGRILQDDGSSIPLHEISPAVAALQDAVPYAIGVYAPQEFRDKVGKAAESVFSEVLK